MGFDVAAWLPSLPGGGGGQSRSTATLVAGGVVATVACIAVYRNLRNWLKPEQKIDVPLERWVDNTDYDESFACDLLTTMPRGISRWMARAAFYPTLYWTMLKANMGKSNPWMSVIDDNIILGALPRGRARDLADMGVGLVVNTCEEWNGNAHEYRLLDIGQVRVEIIDYTAPALAQAELAVEAMQKYLQRNPQGKIYVHCKAGRGRSATILVCFYVAQGMSPLEAQKLLIRHRPQVSKRCWKRKVVKDYVRKHVLRRQ